MPVLSSLVLGALLSQGFSPVKWKSMSDQREGQWSVALKYPVLTKKWPLGELANRVISQGETRAFTEFLASAKKEVPDLRKQGIAGGYDYDSSTEIKVNKARFLSFATNTYVYTAGAHGLGYIKTSNFGIVNGKPKKLRVWDCFVDTPSNHQDLQMRLLEKAMQFENADWVQDGDVTSFDPNQVDNFWVSDAGLNWEFAPYELGSYASGPFTLVLSWGEVKGLVNRKGPLAPLLSEWLHAPDVPR
ncbi:MAG: DUF3298 and DUF4163 domain-containing protein [Armatimonadetes bacterium]|nr:DUF3298 and DUF4163 domain-containing protein [Armatimonadota bacterium]